MAQEKNADYPISSVVRALKVLKLFDQEHREMSLTDISQRAGITKSSVLRILDSLESEGFVRRNAESKKYILGIELFKLGNNGYQFADFKSLTYLIVKKIVDETGLMAHIGIVDDFQILVISKIWPLNGSDAMALISVVGGVVPAHCTGVGKVLLAYSDPKTRDEILDRCQFESYTPNTITSRKVLEKELQQVRVQGYAQNNGEHESYIRCTTYPIFNSRNRILAALSLTGLEQIVESLDPKVIHTALQSATREIQEETSRYQM